MSDHYAAMLAHQDTRVTFEMEPFVESLAEMGIRFDTSELEQFMSSLQTVPYSAEEGVEPMFAKEMEFGDPDYFDGEGQIVIGEKDQSDESSSDAYSDDDDTKAPTTEYSLPYVSCGPICCDSKVMARVFTGDFRQLANSDDRQPTDSPNFLAQSMREEAPTNEKLHVDEQKHEVKEAEHAAIAVREIVKVDEVSVEDDGMETDTSVTSEAFTIDDELQTDVILRNVETDDELTRGITDGSVTEDGYSTAISEGESAAEEAGRDLAVSTEGESAAEEADQDVAASTQGESAAEEADRDGAASNQGESAAEEAQRDGAASTEGESAAEETVRDLAVSTEGESAAEEAQRNGAASTEGESAAEEAEQDGAASTAG